MHIGPHVLKNYLIVAPMAGVTDRPFRQLCKAMGAGMAVSEMIAANPQLWNTAKSQRRSDHRGEIDGRCGAPQRPARGADHRHQHGLPGQKSL
jgi:tRNA-dihydrouridine synthase B